MSWPTVSKVPINGFRTEGYISCAFPTLFPTGDEDFSASRQREVTSGNYFTHLIKNDDGRFARHPRFRYFALNTVMHFHALQIGRIFVNKHPKEMQLSIEELREMIAHKRESLCNCFLHFAASLRGTRQYWFQQRNRLIPMVDSLSLPTTHSAADHQWPELSHLISHNGNCNTKSTQ